MRPDIQQYVQLAQQAGTKHGVPAELLVGQLRAESGFDPAAVSRAGATGIAQLMPDTAKRFGVDARDPAQAIDAQARYMKQLFDQFGSWRGALRAYNWGEGNYGSYLRTGRGMKGQPMPAETAQYPDRVFGHVKAYSGGQMSPPVQLASLDTGPDLPGGAPATLPAVQIGTPQGPHVAMPSTQEEHDLMSGIAAQGYDPDVERQIIGALAQLLPARDMLDGRDLLGDSGLPSDLDPLLRDIVDKA